MKRQGTLIRKSNERINSSALFASQGDSSSAVSHDSADFAHGWVF